MLKNTLKTLFILCSLSGIAHIAYGMEMEQEPKKLKLAQSKNSEEQLRMQRAAELIMKYVKENDLDSLRKCFELNPLVVNQIINKMVVDENDTKTTKCLPLTAAIKKLLDPERADKKDIDYAVATELIKAGANLHMAEIQNYAAKNFGGWLAVDSNTQYFQKPLSFLIKAIDKKDVQLIDFLLENGADPNMPQTGLGGHTFMSPLQLINMDITILEHRLNHGGKQKGPLKTPKLRKPIEQELDLLRTIERKFNYYSEHFKEFNERRKEALKERIQLKISHRELQQKDAGRIQSQRLLRQECFEIDFLLSLNRK